MLDVSRLNDHSRAFAQELFREFPDWLCHARYDPYEEFEREALLVEVPRPAGDGRNGLFITTSEWEIAVGFGEAFHTRFGVGDPAGGAHFQERALAFIREFVAEQIVVVTAFEGETWLGAWTVRVGPEGVPPQEREEGVALRVRSWRGSWDQDLR